MASSCRRKAVNGCDYISNYLVAIGKTESVETLFRDFDGKSCGDSEISIHEIKNGFSILSVSKSEKFEKLNDSFIFFRGWFQDHETKSIVIGQNGFFQWLQNKPNSDIINME